MYYVKSSYVFMKLNKLHKVSYSMANYVYADIFEKKM